MMKLIKYQYQTEDENKNAILKLIDRDTSAKILDLGCGNGEFTRELGTRIGTKNVYGIDGSPEFNKSSRI